MSDESNNPLGPADPPETQPPRTNGETSPETDADSNEAGLAADPPEVQPPGN
jgi:hypothetical protein